MKKILSLAFVLSLNNPVLALGWNGDCPYANDKANQENTEQLEDLDSGSDK